MGYSSSSHRYGRSRKESETSFIFKRFPLFEIFTNTTICLTSKESHTPLLSSELPYNKSLYLSIVINKNHFLLIVSYDFIRFFPWNTTVENANWTQYNKYNRNRSVDDHVMTLWISYCMPPDQYENFNSLFISRQ